MKTLGVLVWIALLLWWQPWEPAPDCVGWRELVPAAPVPMPAQGVTRW